MERQFWLVPICYWRQTQRKRRNEHRRRRLQQTFNRSKHRRPSKPRAKIAVERQARQRQAASRNPCKDEILQRACESSQPIAGRTPCPEIIPPPIQSNPQPGDQRHPPNTVTGFNRSVRDSQAIAHCGPTGGFFLDLWQGTGKSPHRLDAQRAGRLTDKTACRCRDVFKGFHRKTGSLTVFWS